MTCISISLILEVEIVFSFFLEIYTLSTYAEGVSYFVREPEKRHVCVAKKQVSGSQTLCMDLN